MEENRIKRNESKLEVWFVSESLHAIQTHSIIACCRLHWEQMRAIWSYWLNEGTNDFDFPSVHDAMFSHFEPQKVKTETVPEACKHENPKAAKRMEERINKGLATRRAKVIQVVSDLNNWCPHFLANVRSIVGQDASRKELVRCALTLINDTDVDELTKDHDCVGPGMKVDELFLDATNALLPHYLIQPDPGVFLKIHDLLWSKVTGDTD